MPPLRFRAVPDGARAARHESCRFGCLAGLLRLRCGSRLPSGASGNQAKLAELAKRLLERTEGGAIRWEQTDQPSYFTTVLSSGSVAIEQRSGSVFQLSVLNPDGVRLEAATGRTDQETVLSAFDRAPTEDEERLNRFLPGLHDLARRQALGVDEALDAPLLNELD